MIVESRALSAAALVPGGWEVHATEPSSVYSTPCLVVGRPSLVVTGQLYTITNPVHVIGRRMGDEDAAAELDATTDKAMELLRRGAPVQIVAVFPTLHTVAESTYPSYQIDCVTGQGQC